MLAAGANLYSGVDRDIFDLFDEFDDYDSQNTSVKNDSDNNDDQFYSIKWSSGSDDEVIKWKSESPYNDDSQNNPEVEEWESKSNLSINEYSDYKNYEEEDDDEFFLLSWFESSEPPEILSKREIKTTFRKNDPYFGKDLCDTRQYSCIKLKKNDTWKTLFSNAYQRELVQRINRTNKGLWNRNWILVPNDINSDYMDFSPFSDYFDTNNQKTIIIDISELAFAAYDKDGDLVHWGPVNPGKSSTQTVKGRDFKVYRKGGAGCWSKKFDTGIPYCIFFHRGFAMHGYSMPGYPASHGCVRTYVDDALWLNKNFADYQTRVIVQD